MLLSVKKKLCQVTREAIQLSTVLFTFSRVYIFGGIFYNQEIIKMDNLKGDKKCCFSENIGTSTYCIA